MCIVYGARLEDPHRIEITKHLLALRKCEDLVTPVLESPRLPERYTVLLPSLWLVSGCSLVVMNGSDEHPFVLWVSLIYQGDCPLAGHQLQSQLQIFSVYRVPYLSRKDLPGVPRE